MCKQHLNRQQKGNRNADGHSDNLCERHRLGLVDIRTSLGI
nr:MAG TPA: hypothetical protein [Bacteriophage sp.]DAW42477.1 MAG TPA: hypothetical protein [Bacteriophage sp.]DAX22302.1 MAG TPA: hypothetical protein [Bacteriophage sp.]